jgi:hypothetical protein
MLRKINESKGNVNESIAQLESELGPLQVQYQELLEILKAVHLEIKAD